MKNTIGIIIGLGLVAAVAWYYFKVIRRRPQDWNRLTESQRKSYDAALLRASFIDGSQFE